MAMMVGVMGALSSFYQDSLDISDPHQRQEATRRIVAKSATIGAMAYKYSIGQAFVSPKNNLSFSENFYICVLAIPLSSTKFPLSYPRQWILYSYYMRIMNKMHQLQQ